MWELWKVRSSAEHGEGGARLESESLGEVTEQTGCLGVAGAGKRGGISGSTSDPLEASETHQPGPGGY